MWGLFKPRNPILGSDIAGKIDAVGKNVTRFQKGDAVFGDIFICRGGFGEYVCAPESSLTMKPAHMTFKVAAALPQAASIALQGLCDKGHIQSGQKVLINGAGGGAGSFAVQIAKSFGAEVTGVDHGDKRDMLFRIGADHVIDYRQEDFTGNGQRYDLILDFVGSHSIFDYRRALSPAGIYVMVGGSIVHIVQTLLFGSWFSMTGARKMVILAAKPNKDMAFIIDLIESGKITPVIDKCYPLAETAKALHCLGKGQAQGKIVVTME